MASDRIFMRELERADLPAVQIFTDSEIGVGYFSLEKLEEIFAAGYKGGRHASFVLTNSARDILGVRLSFMPGQWLPKPREQAPHPELWRVPFERVGYFQSLFVTKRHQSAGWGKKLSYASMENMRSMGAFAVVCHSWNESPGNSSRRYLDSVGFQPVAEIPLFWKPIDYSCTRCGNPCLCTATEMIYYFG